MAAVFFDNGERICIISNSMSVLNAGFKLQAEYYDRSGATLTYYIHPNGVVLSRYSRRKHQTVNRFYRSTMEANEAFKKMNSGLNFNSGKWIKKKYK